MMSMSFQFRQDQRMSVCGGATDTVLPAVERWLEDGENLRSLRWIARRASRALEYRSLVDLLLCEVCPEHRPACRAFYDGEGVPLRDLANARAIARIERKLLTFLALAHESRASGLIASWTETASATDALTMMEAA